MSKHKLNLKLVETLVDNYKSRQLYSIENSVSYPMAFDARAAMFSLKALKSFIETIEEEVAKHPERPVENIGVRFYYTAYPELKDWEDELFDELKPVPLDYTKLHTLVAVPTMEIAGVCYDFDPFDVNTYDGSKPADTGMGIMAENHGSLYPPGGSTGLWF